MSMLDRLSFQRPEVNLGVDEVSLKLSSAKGDTLTRRPNKLSVDAQAIHIDTMNQYDLLMASGMFFCFRRPLFFFSHGVTQTCSSTNYWQDHKIPCFGEYALHIADM